MEVEDHTYLIMYSAPVGGPRKVIHIGHERDGEMVPRCNSHYVSTNDLAARRQFREVTPEERELRVCKRCINWKPWVW